MRRGGAMLKAGDGSDGRQGPSRRRPRPRSSASERVTGLAFKDGTTLDCDMVVISAGIRPNAEIGLRAA